MTPAHTAQKLREAADLIEPEGAWTQGAYARTSEGLAVRAHDKRAVRWCIIGALLKVDSETKMIIDVQNEVGEIFGVFNDAPNRTQAECVAALRAAADAVEAS